MHSLEEVAERVRVCTLCPLHRGRIKAVPGEGSSKSGIMFVGEAPGRNEDLQGRPFVGAAGQLLDKLIREKLGLSRGEVYITNVVKCRPPGNRDPEPEEIKACWRYLETQILLLKPKLIVALGRHAASTLINGPGSKPISITHARGKTRKVKIKDLEVTVYPTLHPAAALYNKNQLRALEEDFETIAKLARGERQEKTTLYDYFT